MNRAQILRLLELCEQPVTYSALAGLVGGNARNVMSTLPRNHRNSWVVSKKARLPTGYQAQERDPRLLPALQRGIPILQTSAALAAWLATASHP